MAAAGKSRLHARATTAQIQQLKGGVLAKNGKPTACNLAVVDSKAAVVSADCIDMDNGALNQTTKYAVYLDNGADGKAAKYDVESIDVNPGYDATYLVNSFAVLQFNSNGQVTYQNPIAPWLGPTMWDELVYVRYSLQDVDALKWNAPKYASDWLNGGYNCGDLSKTYSANVNDMTCTDKLVAADDSSECPVPYGVVLGIYDGSIMLVGPYTLTAVKDGDNLCDSHDQFSYYSTLVQYHAYIHSVTGREVVSGFQVIEMNGQEQNASFSMTTPKPPMDIAGVSNLHGNWFDTRAVLPESSLLSSSDSTDTQSSAVNNPSQKSSNHTGIIVGVCASVGGLIIISAILYYWSWRRRHGKRFFGHEDMLETELGGQTVGGDSTENEPLPVYEETLQSNANAVAADRDRKASEKREKKS